MNLFYYSKKIFNEIKILSYINNDNFNFFMFSKQYRNEYVIYIIFKNFSKILFELDVIRILKCNGKNEFFNYNIDCGNLLHTSRFGSEYFLTLVIS